MRVNVTVPVFNEENCLRTTLARLHEFLSHQKDFEWEIVVADNGSTDRTRQIAEEFRSQKSEVRIVCLKQKGRGRALKQVWLESEADILSYMDADLSSDLDAFPVLIEVLTAGQHDIAIGSRLLTKETTSRSLNREVVSRCYNRLIKAMFHTTFSDAQCGFKASTRSAAQALLPQVQDTGWFFDTELLILAEKQGYRVLDLPVKWVERRESHVDIFRTAVVDIRGLLRVRRTLRSGSAIPKPVVANPI